MARTIPPKGATMNKPEKTNRQATAFTFLPPVNKKHIDFLMTENPVTIYDRNHPDFEKIAAQITPIHLIRDKKINAQLAV